MSSPLSGNLQPYIEGLIEQKKSLGYPYETSIRHLRSFSRFCRDHYRDETKLTKEIAMHWAEKRPEEHVNTLHRRITPVRQLAKYMNRLGIEAYLIPAGIPGKSVQYVPHIYTEQELRAFFAQLDRCSPAPSSPARHLVIPVFFRLLYCCGLRSSEARLLKVEDVDLENGKVTIRCSKGNKSRTVMMSKELLQLCSVYDARVRQLVPKRTVFFPNPHDQPYNGSMIDYWFHLFWTRTGLADLRSGNRPRVHDFRHTFAVKRLNLWVQQGKDLTACLPYLSMYLGHAHLTATDYYLHLVPEFFPTFREKTLKKSERLLPEVHHEAG